MKNKKGILVFIVAAVMVLGVFGINKYYEKKRNDKEIKKTENSIAEFYEETERLIQENGYTYEEISALQDFQIVDKQYNNAVLERFNKIQGYLYISGLKHKNGGTQFDGGQGTDIMDVEDTNRKDSLVSQYDYDNERESFHHLIRYIILPARIVESSSLDSGNHSSKYYGHAFNFDIEINPKSLDYTCSNEEVSRIIKEQFENNYLESKDGNYFCEITTLNNDPTLGFELDTSKYQSINSKDIKKYIKLGILKYERESLTWDNVTEKYYQFVPK